MNSLVREHHKTTLALYRHECGYNTEVHNVKMLSVPVCFKMHRGFAGMLQEKKHFNCGQPGQTLMEPSVVEVTTGGAGVTIKYPGWPRNQHC